MNYMETLAFSEYVAVMDLVDAFAKLKKSPVAGVTDLMSEIDGLKNFLNNNGVDWEKAVGEAQKSGEKSTVKKSGRKSGSKKPRRASTPAKKSKWEDVSYFDGSSKGYKKCAHSHPLITIDGVGSIQGGSCYSPQGVYDVEIGFDSGMRTPTTLLPWKTQYVRFPITDRSVPASFDDFDKLVDWTIEQMKIGRSVHCGCIGGHGRTGIFLAALIFKAMGEEDSIKWVRDNYCKKAVESSSQVNWLNKHYGIKKQKPRDGYESYASTSYDKKKVSQLSFESKTSTDTTIYPLQGRSVWGSTDLL